MCDLASLTGTYLLSFEAISGNCVSPPARLTRIDGLSGGGEGGAGGSECVETAPDRISDNGCTLELAETCTTDSQVQDYVTIIQQDTVEGDRLSGTMSVDVEDTAGNSVCAGTFRVSFVRQ